MDNTQRPSSPPASKRQRRIFHKTMVELLNIDEGIVEAKEWGEYDIVKKCLESKVDQTELDSMIYALFENPINSLILSSSIGTNTDFACEQLLSLLQYKHDEQAHVCTQLKAQRLYVHEPKREKIQMEMLETSRAIRKLQIKLEQLERAQELNNIQISASETQTPEEKFPDRQIPGLEALTDEQFENVCLQVREQVKAHGRTKKRRRSSQS